MVFCQWLCNRRVLGRLAKVLIRLRACAGWSEALLVANTKLLEISCTGSIDMSLQKLTCADWSVTLNLNATIQIDVTIQIDMYSLVCNHINCHTITWCYHTNWHVVIVMSHYITWCHYTNWHVVIVMSHYNLMSAYKLACGDCYVPL